MLDNRIQVLWVENDPKITEAYPREAEMREGIELYAYPSWEEAEEALESDYARWDAIILDAKCCYRKNDADLATRFLVNVFRRIEYFAKVKKQTLPWYVLSGQGEEDIHDLIPEKIEWDSDWEKISHRRFYSKNDKVTIGGKEMHERHALFSRIKTQVIHNNQQMRIEYDEYPDVFRALDKMGLECEVGFHLMPLLEPIHFKGTDNADYNRRYVDLRKSLENIFRHMIGKGLLPDGIISKNKKENVNLSWSSLFLGAEQPETPENVRDSSEQKFWSKYERLTDGPILPKQLAYWLKSAIFQAGGAVHSSTGDEEIIMNLDKYLPHVSNSPYMLRSLAMGLCDLILWYDNFLIANPDEEMNAINFWRKRNSKI